MYNYTPLLPNYHSIHINIKQQWEHPITLAEEGAQINHSNDLSFLLLRNISLHFSHTSP